MKIAITTNTDQKSPRNGYKFVRVLHDTNTTNDYIEGMAVGTPSGGIKQLAEDQIKSKTRFTVEYLFTSDSTTAGEIAETLRRSYGVKCYNKRKISTKKTETIARK
jgi:hypothetical protein